ncbi:MAG: zinc ribbon-containing protein, partial [Deltaproteobacteria bacterium]|nr:zinc ribbon-containing protein [Deltaproteobacteria bacterium]
MSKEDHPKKEEQNNREGLSDGGMAELYEKMSRIFQEKLQKTGEVTEEVFEKALHESREWGEKLKEHYSEDVARVTESIRRDWLNAINYTREQTKRSFDLDRMQAGVLGFISMLAKSAGSQLEHFADRINERLTYKTGEIAGSGNLECGQCGQQLSFDHATRVPPCPKCRGTVFK